MVEWVESEDDTEGKGAVSMVTSLYGTVTDVEAFFTDLDLGQGAFASLGERKRNSMVYTFRRCIAAWFTDIHKRNSGPTLYSDLTIQMAPGDCVVSFNYDTALDAELVRQGMFRVCDGYGFHSTWDELPSDVMLLKLHGSINWCGEIGLPRAGSASAGVRIIGPSVDNREGILPVYPHVILDTRSRQGGMIDSSVTMVLPTCEKRFAIQTSVGDEWKQVFDGLWNLAEDFLSQSDRSVLIGYSMPGADERASELLLHKSNRHALLNLCCGTATHELEARFRGAGFSRINTLADPSFQGFLAAR